MGRGNYSVRTKKKEKAGLKKRGVKRKERKTKHLKNPACDIGLCARVRGGEKGIWEKVKCPPGCCVRKGKRNDQ